MGNFIQNISAGRFAHLATLPAANDALIAVPLESAGLEADSALRDHDNLSVLLAASNNEQVTMGRKTLTGVTVTVDDTNNRVDVDANDVTWTAATGNAVGKLLICYDPDTTGGTDTDIIPLSAHDFVVVPSSVDIVATISVGGFARAQA